MDAKAEKQYVEYLKKHVNEINVGTGIICLCASCLLFGVCGFILYHLNTFINAEPSRSEQISSGYWDGMFIGLGMMIFIVAGTIALLAAVRSFRNGTPAEKLLIKYYDQLYKDNKSSNHGLESTGAPPAAGTPETHP